MDHGKIYFAETSIRKAIKSFKIIKPIGDIVFIHGLGGDCYNTWHPKEQKEKYWPAWIQNDFKNMRVWTLSYPAEITGWTSEGAEMSLYDRAKNILEYLSSYDIGSKPIIIIGHSLGGLLIKQLLRVADSSTVRKWREFLHNCKGVVFISTPHSGSSLPNIADALRFLKITDATKELKEDAPNLRDLASWYSQNARRLGIKTQAYSENEKILSTLIVSPTSADPNVEGCVVIPLDGNHITICKPQSKQSPIYSTTKKFISECLAECGNKNQNQGSRNIDIPDDNDEWFSSTKSEINIETQIDTDKVNIELRIDRDFDSYTEEDQNKLLDAIRNLLNIDGNLRISNKKKGSVKLTLELTHSQAEKLYWAIKSGEFSEYDLNDATISEEQQSKQIDEPLNEKMMVDSLDDGFGDLDSELEIIEFESFKNRINVTNDFSTLKLGDIIPVTVSTITATHIFLNVFNQSITIHRNELGEGIQSPTEVVKLGQKIYAKIIKIKPNSTIIRLMNFSLIKFEINIPMRNSKGRKKI